MGITSADFLRNSIKNHSHYGSCLNGSRYRIFHEKSNILDLCNNYKKNVNRLTKEIIEENNKLKIKEKEATKSREVADREYELFKEKFKSEEDNEIKYNENKLKNLEEKKKNEKKAAKNEIEKLKKDIENMKEIIETLRNKNTEEEKWKKEEIINNLQHEYELKLDRYKLEKEYQRLEKEQKIRLMEKKYKLEKEVEFAELKKSSDLVDKIINCIKFNNSNLI